MGGPLRHGSSVLRLRRVDGRATLTFKKRIPGDSAIKHQREDDTAVADPEAMEAILDALGFAPALVYEKRRQTWVLGKTEIVVDVLPFGLFMESEGRANAIRAVELVVEPGVRRLVLREALELGVEEEVGVDEDHRKSSPSANASMSETLCTPVIAGGPGSTGSVR